MDKYFELRDKTGTYFGVIRNIPKEMVIEDIKERIETKSDEEEIIVVEDIFLEVDIEFDWDKLDDDE